MHLNRRVQLQLAFFAVIALLAGGYMTFSYLDVPKMLFGVGHYQVVMDLPNSAGLYPNANVTYRGTEVGRVDGVRLSDTGVEAVLTLRSNMKIPADLDAQVHSQSAVGEQFVELVPRSGGGATLGEGDVIPAERTSVPPDINALLSTTNAGLQAIPHDNLKTAIDESFIAFGGLGPELSRIVNSTTTLASDARASLDAITAVIDRSKPILDTQTGTSDSIQAWAANLAVITGQLQSQDPAVQGILQDGPAAFGEFGQLFDRLQPTLPVLLTNLVSLADVAVVYQPALEQLLVLLPPAIENLQGSGIANRNTKQNYRGAFLSFNLNVNLPPPCNTGFLPPQQARSMSEVDYPDRPAGDLYCRVPQDSQLNVRGARNAPCITRPGKRAPTVKMCESDENYVPLNDGFNWKGDPNATLSGQAVPQIRPDYTPPPAAASLAPPPPDAAPTKPIAITTYDPATGTYIGPDGQQYTQSNLAQNSAQPPSWQDLLVPPKGN